MIEALKGAVSAKSEADQDTFLVESIYYYAVC